MKILAWSAVVMGSVVALAACGGSGGSGGSGGGTGGSTGTTSATTTSGTTASTSGSTVSTSGTTTSGTTSSGVTTSTNPGGCGTLQYANDPACQTCVETSCCAELKACDTGTDCGGILDCAAACTSGDTACISACTQNMTAPGFSDVQAMVNCYANSCEMDPACATGAICDSGLEHPNVACGMCLGANCCAEFQDCVADPGTPGGETCLDCVTGAAADPTACMANALYTAVTTCQTTNCTTECTSTGGICDSGLTTQNDACDMCLGTNCCDTIKTCQADTATNGCNECLLGDATDMAACMANAQLTAVNGCFSGVCGTQCM